LIAGNTAMELPLLKTLEAYQGLWADVWQDIFEFVMTFGGIKPDDQFVDIDLPEILATNNQAMIDSIVKAADKFPEIVYSDEVQKYMLTLLGLNNVDEVYKNIKSQSATASKEVREAFKTMRDSKVTLTRLKEIVDICEKEGVIHKC